MQIYLFLLILIYPVISMTTSLVTFYSPEELAEMGVCLENPEE